MLESWPEHSTRTSDGDDTDVFALAVSFWNRPLLAPGSPLQQFSILLPFPTASACLRRWAETGAGSGPPGPVLPAASPLASPSHARALPHGHLGSERCLGVVCPLQATLVMWKILQVPCVPHVVTVYLPRLFVHLLFQVFFSTVEMPEKVENLWRACQEQHGLATDPHRCSMPVLLSLPCPQGRSQCPQRDPGFALHTGLQCRP